MNGHAETAVHADGAAIGPSLADRMKGASAALHRQAERTGIMADLLGGRVAREAYLALLRNLLPAYLALEGALQVLPAGTPARVFARPVLYRAPSLRADLDALAGPGWPEAPLDPAARRYASRIAAVAVEDPDLLIAHGYVRYLGDLNGGQVFGRLLGRHLAVPAGSLSFHHFEGIDDPRGYALSCRAALDALSLDPAAAERVIAEVQVAFGLNIALSDALAAAGDASKP